MNQDIDYLIKKKEMLQKLLNELCSFADVVDKQLNITQAAIDAYLSNTIQQMTEL